MNAAMKTGFAAVTYVKENIDENTDLSELIVPLTDDDPRRRICWGVYV